MPWLSSATVICRTVLWAGHVQVVLVLLVCLFLLLLFTQPALSKHLSQSHEKHFTVEPRDISWWDTMFLKVLGKNQDRFSFYLKWIRIFTDHVLTTQFEPSSSTMRPRNDVLWPPGKCSTTWAFASNTSCFWFWRLPLRICLSCVTHSVWETLFGNK